MAIILERLEELGYVSRAASPSRSAGHDGDGAYSDEEEREVADRLRALGYI
jgi:hypothetical protein